MKSKFLKDGPPARGVIQKSARSRAAAERREGKRLIVGIDVPAESKMREGALR